MKMTQQNGSIGVDDDDQGHVISRVKQVTFFLAAIWAVYMMPRRIPARYGALT